MTALRVFNAFVFLAGFGAGVLGLAELGSSTTVFQQIMALMLLLAGAGLVGVGLVVESVACSIEATKETNRLMALCREELARLADYQRIAGQLAERQAAALERLKRQPPPISGG